MAELPLPATLLSLARLDFSVDRSANPVAGFSKSRRTFLLLLGEKATKGNRFFADFARNSFSA
jgi:hypothetical protein